MDFESAKEKAIKYIGISKKTSQEVRNKLNILKCEKNVIDDVINYLISVDYINDNEYIDAYIRQNMRLLTMSIYQIKQKLLQKGIKKDIIEEKLEILYNSDYEKRVLEKLYSKKFKNMEDIKIKKYLYQKGFLSNEF